MSVSRNFGRTLSGQTDLNIDNINLPNTINTIRIGGNSGLPNQVLAKNGTTNKLEWDYVESTTIPINSIAGDKLKNDITIVTTGDIEASKLEATFSGNYNNQEYALDLPKVTNGGSTIGGHGHIAGNLKVDGTIFGSVDGAIREEIVDCQRINLRNDPLAGGGLTGINIIDNFDITSNGNITTTGDITGDIITATNKFIQSGTAENTFNGNIDLPTANITATSGDITANNLISTNTISAPTGYFDTIELPEIGSETIRLLGSTGTITCEDININNHTGIIDFNEIKTNKLVLPIVGTTLIELDGSNGHIDCNVLNSNTVNNVGEITTDGIGSQNIVNQVNIGTNTLNSNGIANTGVIVTATLDSTTINNVGDINNTGDITASTGNIIASVGNVTATAGDIISTAGDVVGTQLLAGSGVTIYGSLNSTGLSIGGEKVISAGSCEATISNIVINGNHGTQSVIIGGDTSILASTGDTPQNGDLSVAGDYTSLNGNITLTNGTLFANVDGNITEEIVDCKRINLREDVSVAGLTELNITATGTNYGQINFVGGAVETAIDFNRRIVRSENDRILLNGNDGNLTATGSSSFCSSTSVSSFTIDDSATGNTYSNKCKNINIGNTGVSVMSAITINGNITMVKNATNITGTGNITSEKYRNQISNFQIDGVDNRHTLTGTRRELVSLRNTSDTTARIISIPNNLGITVGTYGYGQVNYWWLDDVVAVTPNIRIYMEAYINEKVGTNGDLYVRIDSATGLASSYYPSQKSVTIVNNSEDKLARRFNFSILITGLTIGTKYDFIPKFGTSSLAQLYFNYGGVFGDMLLSYEFIDDYLFTSTDPYAPSDDY